VAQIRLVNKSRRAITLNLPYSVVGVSFCERQLTGRVVADKRGQKAVKAENKRVSRAITLGPKGSAESVSEALPHMVERCPEVKEALVRGLIAIEHVQAEAPAMKPEQKSQPKSRGDK